MWLVKCGQCLHTKVWLSVWFRFHRELYRELDWFEYSITNDSLWLWSVSQQFAQSSVANLLKRTPVSYHQRCLSEDLTDCTDLWAESKLTVPAQARWRGSSWNAKVELITPAEPHHCGPTLCLLFLLTFTRQTMLTTNSWGKRLNWFI